MTTWQQHTRDCELIGAEPHVLDAPLAWLSHVTGPWRVSVRRRFWRAVDVLARRVLARSSRELYKPWKVGTVINTQAHAYHGSDYVVPDQPERCPDCGGLRVHDRTCRTLEPEPCPDCGTLGQHAPDCIVTQHEDGRIGNA